MASGLLGTKTGDFLTWVTIGLVGVFLTLAVVMAKFYKPEISSFGEQAPQQQSAPQQQEKSELPPVPEQTAPARLSEHTRNNNADFIFVWTENSWT